MSAFTPIRYGVDDITLGFDMTGSRSVRRLNELPGNETRRGKMLGARASWGAWAHVLGRSVSFWKADTCRLYVQAKLAPDGELCSPRQLGTAVQALTERMAIVGITSWEPAWVTRLDVAVDASCAPRDGKLLLDALAAVRPPNGWRVTSEGSPRSTVYFRSRVRDTVKARTYCRNLKLRVGEPFGVIRTEASERYKPRDLMLDSVDAAFAAGLWESRFGRLSQRVTRLGREVQASALAAKMESRELTHGEAERLHLFLDLERIGVAASAYRRSVYAQRRREAVRLGYSVNDHGSEPAAIDLGSLLAVYREVVRKGRAAY